MNKCICKETYVANSSHYFNEGKWYDFNIRTHTYNNGVKEEIYYVCLPEYENKHLPDFRWSNDIGKYQVKFTEDFFNRIFIKLNEHRDKLIDQII